MNDILTDEVYTYSEEEIYRNKIEWNSDKSVRAHIFLDEEAGNIKYSFHKDGFLIECLDFEYEDTVKKTEYEYVDNRLFKLIQFLPLAYKKTLLGKIKLTGKAQFMNETEHYSSEEGLLEKEVVKDYDTKELVEITYDKYEYN